MPKKCIYCCCNKAINKVIDLELISEQKLPENKHFSGNLRRNGTILISFNLRSECCGWLMTPIPMERAIFPTLLVLDAQFFYWQCNDSLIIRSRRTFPSVFNAVILGNRKLFIFTMLWLTNDYSNTGMRITEANYLLVTWTWTRQRQRHSFMHESLKFQKPIQIWFLWNI